MACRPQVSLAGPKVGHFLIFSVAPIISMLLRSVVSHVGECPSFWVSLLFSHYSAKVIDFGDEQRWCALLIMSYYGARDTTWLIVGTLTWILGGCGVCQLCPLHSSHFPLSTLCSLNGPRFQDLIDAWSREAQRPHLTVLLPVSWVKSVSEQLLSGDSQCWLHTWRYRALPESRGSQTSSIKVNRELVRNSDS